jgi:hypothetical protein
MIRFIYGRRVFQWPVSLQVGLAERRFPALFVTYENNAALPLHSSDDNEALGLNPAYL